MNLGVGLRAPCFWQSLVCLGVARRVNFWIFLGDVFWFCFHIHFFVRQSWRLLQGFPFFLRGDGLASSRPRCRRRRRGSGKSGKKRTGARVSPWSRASSTTLPLCLHSKEKEGRGRRGRSGDFLGLPLGLLRMVFGVGGIVFVTHTEAILPKSWKRETT